MTMPSNNRMTTKTNDRWSDGASNHATVKQSPASPPPMKPSRRASNDNGGGVTSSTSDRVISHVDIKRMTLVDGNLSKSRIRWLAAAPMNNGRGDRPLGVPMPRRSSIPRAA